jgi:hypothetical protein
MSWSFEQADSKSAAATQKRGALSSPPFDVFLFRPDLNTSAMFYFPTRRITKIGISFHSNTMKLQIEQCLGRVSETQIAHF